jgi:N-acetylneuraminic acid mutarotase
MLSRRSFVAALAAGAATPALAQHQHHHDDHLFSHLNDPKVKTAPADIMKIQHVFDSPAPRAATQGRWATRAPLPLPRSEMAWATAKDGRMHVLGGYAEQRVDRPYHHVYDPAANRWIDAPPLPRGANHVGVAVLDGKLYAVGGHLDQNRKPDPRSFVLEGETWREIAPLPQRCGAVALVGYEARIHSIGGAIGDTTASKKSVDWHWAYDPKDDKWTDRAPLPTGRDHTGTLVVNGLVHVIGGRVDNFHTNSNLHHTYEGKTDRWTFRNPLPTARSGHGAVLYRDRIFIMGGEGTNRVFGQNEAFDPKTDRWESYAPMLTPRHGMGAVAIGDSIYVAGGGPIMGGSIQSALNEAFTLG